MKNSLLPADTYTIINQTILTEVDKKIIISLYEPIIGPIAVSLYLTLWADLDKLEIMSKDFTHHHLMTILKTKLVDIENARKSLEAVGLLKSYIKRNDNINEYLYELYSPLSASEFLNHPVLSVLLLNNIGENEYNSHLFRFPGGYWGGKYAEVKKQAEQILEQNDVLHIDWNALTSDAAGAKTTEQFIAELNKTVPKHNSIVVLMHDAGNKTATANALPTMIKYFRDQGFEFENFYSIIK